MSGSVLSRHTVAVDTKLSVSALLLQPDRPRACIVLGHGAGAGMEHASMALLSEDLASVGLSTLRYQFPYMERGSRRPDPPPLCHATVRAAVEAAGAWASDLPLFAGGRSFGGRMSSQAQASMPLPRVRGLVFFAFPLHPADQPGIDRAAHLARVAIPMLFLQGTRDALASRSLLEPVVKELGGRATLKLLEGADHAFHVPARGALSAKQLRADMLETLVSWIDSLAS